MTTKRFIAGMLVFILVVCHVGAEEVLWDVETTEDAIGPQVDEGFVEESAFENELLLVGEEAMEDQSEAAVDEVAFVTADEELSFFMAEDDAFISDELVSASIVDSGKCGDHISWTLDSEGTLTISGTGEMYDFDGGNSPWHDYYEEIYELHIDEGVTSIGRYAFYDLVQIPNVILPDSLITLKHGAFTNCNSLGYVVLPKNVRNISGNPFGFCPELTDGVSVDEENEYFDVVDGALINTRENILIYYPAHNGVKNYAVPDNIKIIGEGAFEDSALESITLPNGLERIEDSAFLGCGSLKFILFSSALTYIGDDAFDSCIELTNIKIPEGVTSLGARAFYECTNLESVLIPSSVKSIGADAFHYYEENEDGGFDRYVPENLVIYCSSGSFAEEYAIENGIPTEDEEEFPSGEGQVVKLELSLKDRFKPLIDGYSFPEEAEYRVPNRIICEAVYSDGTKKRIDEEEEHLDYDFDTSSFEPGGESNIVTVTYQGISASIHVPIMTFEEGMKTLPAIEVGKELKVSYFLDDEEEEDGGDYLGFVGATFSPTESGIYLFSYPCSWTASFVSIYDFEHNLVASDSDEDVSDLSVKLEAGKSYLLLFSADDEDGSFKVTAKFMGNPKPIKLEKPKKPSLENNKSGVLISFEPVDNAYEYEIKRVSASGEYTFTTLDAEYLDISVEPMQTYIYYVKAKKYMGLDGKIYSASKKSKGAKICWVPACKGFKAKVMDNGLITLSWKKNIGATGYQVGYRKSNNKLISETIDVNGKKTNILLSKGNWYTRVRAYIEVSGKTYYGPWTKEKKVKVK